MSLPYPTNQLVFNGGSQDVGTANSLVTVTDTPKVVSYINYDGKDCVYINSAGQTPSISIPYVVSETSSFTLSFWINAESTAYWKIAVGIDDEVNSIIEYALYGGFSIITYGPSLNNSELKDFELSGWTHVVLTYINNTYNLYKDGVAISTINFNNTFTSTRINIGGNNPYGNWRYGGENSPCVVNIRQLCTFDSVLTVEQVGQLYTQTQDNTVLAQESNPLVPHTLTVSSITSTSFTVSWLGGTGASSYVYTLNGYVVTPSTDNGVSNNSATFTDLTDSTEYSLVVIAINSSESQSSASKSVTTLLNPPTSISLSINTITIESFAAVWTGGVGATSYTYTLNGSPVTSSSETSQSAIFTSLTPLTQYSLIVTAVNAGGETSSTPVSITTLDLPPLYPINQFIFNGISDDVGIQPVNPILTDPDSGVSYTNNSGKDCIHVISNGTNPTLNIPCVFTETSSFTVGFWIKIDNVGAWCVPITINGNNVNFSFGFDVQTMIYAVGDGISTMYQQSSANTGSSFLDWNYIALRYQGGVLKIYINGVSGSSISFTQAFTTSQITIGGNDKYQYSFGGQSFWDGYLHQLCVFDSPLTDEEIGQLYIQTEGNRVLALQSNPLNPYGLNIFSKTASSFTVSWLGGTGATSYVYTLNGSPYTPSTDDGVSNKSAIFTGLTQDTSYSLVVIAINSSESQSSFSKTLKTLPNPPTSITLSIDTITFESFTANWIGGVGATSYKFTLNGSLVTPSLQTFQSAIFRDLNHLTQYSLVITPVNAGGETPSTSVSVTTLDLPPLYPINQLVLSNSSEDLGTNSTTPVTEGTVSYITYSGEECLNIVSSGTGTSYIRVPCVFTETSSFTISFWSYMYDSMNNGWYTPITLNDGTKSIILFGMMSESMYMYVGAPPGNYENFGGGIQYNSVPININRNSWNNFTITYSSGTYKLYVNGIFFTSKVLTESFTSTQITIGENLQYTTWNFGQTPGSMYIRQVCVFDFALFHTQINELYTETQDNTVLLVPLNPLTPYKLNISSITTTSFRASWLGGSGATSYSYTLNGSNVTPSTDSGVSNKSATFTGLNPNTSYSLIITAITVSDSQASFYKSIRTFAVPINQLTLSDSSEDLGSNLSTPVTIGNVSYVTYAGKECVNVIRSANDIPSITVPCVFTETSSFTISFWSYSYNGNTYYYPIGLDDGTKSIITIAILNTYIYVVIGSQENHTYVADVSYTNLKWNNFVIRYTAGRCTLFINGIAMSSRESAISFTSTQITIGENSKYNSWFTPPFEGNVYIRQLCIFDSALTTTQINELYVQTQYNTVLEPPSNPLIIYSLKISSITKTSFTASWLGGTSATSYTYTLNGSPAIPSIDNGVSNNSATFTNLSLDTLYSIVVTAVSGSESQASRSKSVRTFMQLPFPTNQLVLNVSNDDLGSNPTIPVTTGDVSYINYFGKDCMTVTSFGLGTSYTTVPCVFTEASSFTISFWGYIDDTVNWRTSITLNDGTKSIIMFALITESIIVYVGAAPGNYNSLGEGIYSNGISSSNINTGSWNNFTMTYTGGTYKLYVNGNFSSSTILTDSFTSTQITIGENAKYTTWNLGQAEGPMYIRQLCIFNSALIDNQITQLYGQTQENFLLLPVSDVLKIYNLITSNIDFTTLTISWSGGSGATSYRYTINGSLVTPSIDNGLVSQSATFTGLTANTTYSLVVTAVSGSESKASNTLSVKTRKPLPAPTNQLVFNGFTADVGTASLPVVLTDPTGIIEYTNYSGKDCIHINSDGSNTKLTIPYIVTETSSFTLSYWVNMANDGFTWEVPLALGDEINTILFSAINQPSVYIKSGDSLVSGATSIMSDWNHIVIAYSNKISRVYVNGDLRFMLALTNKFTSTEINICGNSSYALPQLGPTVCNAYIRQLCVFDSSLNSDQVNQLYVQTQGNTIFTIKSNTSVPYGMVISNIDYTTFTVSWSGGTGTTSYSYTLNGSTYIPSIDNALSSKSVTFTGLTANTTYSLVVTSVSASGSNSSSPVSVKTRIPLPLPSNQLVFNGLSQDVGIEYAPLTLTDPNSIIEYTNRDGIDCIHINSDGYEPRLNITFIFTETSSFTFAFRIKFDNVGAWCVPITINGNNINISLGFNSEGLILVAGDALTSSYSSFYAAGSYFPDWNHIIVTHKNGGLRLYRNGVFLNYMNFTQEFTTSQITIGGNTKYQFGVGGQINWDGYFHQLCTFDSALNDDQVVQLYTQTQGNTVLAPPLSPLNPYRLSISSITTTSFTASWLGGTSATSYRYTLNGSPATPSTDTGVSNKSATFTGLTPNTSYSLIITAVSASDSKSSRPKTVTTFTPLTVPINQLIFNSKSDDVGTNLTTPVTRGNVSYINYSGKDCINVIRSGTDTSYITIPCAFTNTSSFTISFSLYVSSTSVDWFCPICLNDGTRSILTFASWTNSILLYSGVYPNFDRCGAGWAYNPVPANINLDGWNNFTVTYTNGRYVLYTNGILTASKVFIDTFTSTEIRIGENLQYTTWISGETEAPMYIRQLCVFDSALNAGQITQLYVNTQDDTVLNTRLPTLEDVTNLQNTFNNTTTIEGASASIDAAIALNMTPVVVLAAALATASPRMFTALVNNSVFIGSTVSIPSNIARVLYASFADKSTLNTRLPLKVNFPAIDGKVNPPTAGSNSKLAIDLTVDTYVPFRGCTGYGIHVIGGEQYFTTPSNPVGTLVHVGDIITFTLDVGGTIVSKVADLDIVLIPYTPPQVICFLGSAPVLTPKGYSRIDSLKVGDLVSTPSSIEGEEGQAIIEKIHKQVYSPDRFTNPYVIPEGKFGSHGRLLISPRHKVAVNGEMIEARDLGLEQEEQYEKITYYNLQIANRENMIVAGLEVESLQELTRMNIPIETFNYIITNKYNGILSDEMKEKCHLTADGTISVPMLA